MKESAMRSTRTLLAMALVLLLAGCAKATNLSSAVTGAQVVAQAASTTESAKSSRI
jgi:hypothetical protein